MAWNSCDDENQAYLDAADPSHWAYRQGKAAGLKGDRSQRGLMRFGSGCAGDAVSAANTRQWLAGFHAGLKEYEAGHRQPWGVMQTVVENESA